MAKDRKPAEVERDRRLISTLYLQGKIQAEIAFELKISQATVSRELKFLQAEWQKERVYNINEAKFKELEKLDILEREYWKAWERSQHDAVSTSAGISGGKKTQLTKTEAQVGDPRFLDGVQNCIKQRCAILGVEAPKKIEGQLSNIDISKFTDDQLRRLADGEDIISVLINAQG